MVRVLAFQPGGHGSNPVGTLYFSHAFSISFFVTNFVHKTILGSSNSAEDKDIMSKYGQINEDTII